MFYTVMTKKLFWTTGDYKIYQQIAQVNIYIEEILKLVLLHVLKFSQLFYV